MVATYLSSLRRSRLALVVIASAVLAVGCDDAPTAPAADTTPPPIPALVSPANGIGFTHFPRAVTLVWNPVSDPSAPVTYRVEVQFCQSGTPTNCTSQPAWCAGAITEITCSFNFVGAQPGRWRVRAVDATGNESAFSEYRTFSFSS